MPPLNLFFVSLHGGRGGYLFSSTTPVLDSSRVLGFVVHEPFVQGERQLDTLLLERVLRCIRDTDDRVAEVGEGGLTLPADEFWVGIATYCGDDLPVLRTAEVGRVHHPAGRHDRPGKNTGRGEFRLQGLPPSGSNDRGRLGLCYVGIAVAVASCNTESSLKFHHDILHIMLYSHFR